MHPYIPPILLTEKLFHAIRHIVYAILTVCCICWVQNIQAQETTTQFKHFSIDDGLSQNMVTSIIEDHNGYIWFGTKDGLNRYDGYTFKVYKTKPFDAYSLSDNYITSLYEDAHNNLWIGTVRGGVHVYNEEKDNFIKIRTGKEHETESVSTITGNLQNDVWISFAQGKVTYIQSLGKIQDKVPASFSKSGFYRSNKKHIVPRIESIFLDSDGLLWILGNCGIMVYDTKTRKPYTKKCLMDGYLISFNGEQKKVEKLNGPVDLSTIDSRKIWEDDKKNLWLTTIDRLIRIDKNANRLTYFDFNLPGGNEKNRASSVISKTTGASAELWVALHDGILTLDMQDTSIKQLPSETANPAGLVKSRAIVFYKDKTENIWLGSNGDGISFYSPFKSTFTNGLPEALRQGEATGKSIASMLAIKNDGEKEILLLGTYDNLIQSEKNKKTKTAPNFETLHGYLTTRAMAIDKKNNIWMDGMSGIVRYNPYTKTSETFPYLDSDSSITSILPDANEDIIWYTSATILYRFDYGNKSLEKFSLPNYSESIFSDKLHAVLYQDGNMIWVGTADGLVMFDTEKKKIVGKFVHEKNNKNSISSAEIKCIHGDPFKPDRYIWIGTGGGLNRLDKESKTFIHFTMDDGLPNNTIYGMLADETGKLWLSTNRGLSVFNTLTETFTNFDVNNGLQSNEFNTGAYFKASDGEMFFGGINGFNQFYPKDIIIPKREIPIVVSNMELQLGSNKENIKLYHKAANKLAYNQNNISITLASLDFSAPEKISYAYRIKNHDTSWISLGNSRNITLTNLSPGKYVFQARGTDSYGRWGHNTVEATFVISSPWWQTWWAYSIYILALIGIVAYAWNRYKKQLENQQKREEALRKTEAIMEMDKIKSRFLANISHEFRTPLTLIKGHIEVLKESGSDLAVQRKFSEMENNSDHILHLINQLLDLSKMESGEYKLIFRRADVLADIKRTVYSFQSLAEQKGIALSLDIQPEAEIHLQGEHFIYSQEALTTILNNLISNACKFTDEGKIHISIKFADSDSRKSISVSIQDTGAGIRTEDLPKIFDRFYQVDSSMSRRYEGSGIGLALVKELAILHGGNVEAESIPGQGATFTVILAEGPNNSMDEPTRISSVQEKPKAAEIVIDEPLAAKNEKQALVLVVEDNDDLRKFICDTLVNEWQCVGAIDGHKGFEMAQELVPDLIISDVMMPGMDGFELCTKLKLHESTCHIPVIMLTAKASQTDRLQGFETGADDYLAKPFSTKELQVRIQNLLRSRRILRQKFSTSVWMKPEEMEVSSKDKIFLQKLIDITEQHIQNEQFGVEILASEVGLSTSQLNRKLKALTNESALYFIRNIRMQKALQLLRAQTDNIAGVAYETGFDNPNYFSKVFKQHFGFLPSDREKVDAIK